MHACVWSKSSNHYPFPLLSHVMLWLSAQVNSFVAEKKVQVIWSHEKGMSTTLRHSHLLTWCIRLVHPVYDIQQRPVVIMMMQYGKTETHESIHKEGTEATGRF